MIRFISGDCRERLKDLPDQSVQCVVTSPPYFGLRDYGTSEWSGGWDPGCDHARHVVGGPKQTRGAGQQNGHASAANKLGRRECIKCGAVRTDNQIGLEPSPAAYVAELVGVFREVRRVLRDDGTVWLNLGDSYASTSTYSAPRTSGGEFGRVTGQRQPSARASADAKPKDLLMIPARVAIALRDDGWYLRRDVIWSKPNPMPESCTDRPTTAHEYLFLLTKKSRYFYDAEAIAEPSEYPGDNRALRTDTRKSADAMCADGGRRARTGNPTGSTRNARSVWTIAPAPFSEAHFATFPPKLAETCILAGTSEMGACPGCGAPWARTITKGEPDEAHRAACGADSSGGYAGQSTKNHDAAGVQNASDVKRRILDGLRKKTYGWQPTCDCPAADPRPCVVLDPFSGAGTAALVADRLGRDAIGIDLNPTYGEMARERLIKDAGMFAEFGP